MEVDTFCEGRNKSKSIWMNIHIAGAYMVGFSAGAQLRYVYDAGIILFNLYDILLLGLVLLSTPEEVGIGGKKL